MIDDKKSLFRNISMPYGHTKCRDLFITLFARLSSLFILNFIELGAFFQQVEPGPLLHTM